DIDEARAGAQRLAEERGQTVSEQNVERVQEMYEAFNRGDIERALNLLHPQPVLHQNPEVVDAEAYIGLEAFLRGMSLFTEEWDTPRLDPQEVDEVGDFVLMRVRVSGRGKASGIEMETELFHAWAFRNGKPWRCVVRSSRGEALQVLEMRE